MAESSFDVAASITPTFQHEGPPKMEGISRSTETQVDPVDPSVVPGSSLGRGTTLTDLSRDHVFFTHSLLFTHGFWPVDPVEDHIRDVLGKCNPFQIQLPSPVFSGCIARDPDGKEITRVWDSIVVAVPSSEWMPLFESLCRVMGTLTPARRLYRVLPVAVPLVDVLSIQLNSAASRPPYVPCVCFDLLGNHKTVYFAPGLRKDPWSPIPVKTRPPAIEMIRLADNIFDRKKRPLDGAIEPTAEEAMKRLQSLDKAGQDVLDSPKEAGDRERSIIKEMTQSRNLLKRVGLI